jgi:S-adenosyl-L-methionine hydrolase (adenosine-forming)
MSSTGRKDVSLITLTSDFGVSSPYVAEMKGAILSINPSATIIDISHAIEPQDIQEGAVVFDMVHEAFPPGTIHVGVVDPGVGSDRPIIAAEINGQFYIAPDNGLLSLLVRREKPEKMVRLENDRFWRRPVSPTFHGRDIFAPVAAHLSLGIDLDQLGPPYESVCQIDLPEPATNEDRISGVVLKIDSFGNLITNIPAKMFVGRPTDSRACVACGIYETWGIYQTYAQQAQGTLIAVIGSNGLLELAVTGENAADRLGINVGTPVAVGWEFFD